MLTATDNLSLDTARFAFLLHASLNDPYADEEIAWAREVLLVEWQNCVSVNLCTRVRTIFEGLFTEIYSVSCFWRDIDFGALRTENPFLRGTLEDRGVIAKRVDNRSCV